MIKLLDCTIRDGGHLNGWNFTEECVLSSYNAAFDAGIDYFEVGYRNSIQKKEWGNLARCEDDYLFSLFTESPKLKLSIMIDAGKSDIRDFKECSPKLTPISLVRVATYPQRLDTAISLCQGLKEKGYEVILNLMVFSEYTNTEFEKIKKHRLPKLIDAICFGDSFGSFMPDEIVKFKNILSNLGFQKICFHSHNNLQLAFANSLKAIENNFYCIDASIYGMGRDAGNLPIELITGYLNKIGQDKYNPIPYLEVIQKYYIKHSQETPWGYNLNSFIGGIQNIHPYYINGLFEHNSDIKKVWSDAEYIKKNAPVFYEPSFIKKK